MKTQLNDEAKQHFKQLKKVLSTAGRYAEGDEKALERLAHLYSLSDKFEEAMNKETTITPMKVHLHLYDKVLKNILALEVVFQLNPGSRSRGKVTPAKEKKGFDTSMRK